MTFEQSQGVLQQVSRRGFFDRVASGVGGAALAWLLEQDLTASERRIHDLSPKEPNFKPQAQAVIHLFMNGGPSQMDLFDPKPELDRSHGKSYFDKIAGEVESPDSAGLLMRSPFKFKKYGECGMDVSDAMPYFSECVDDVALIRSVHTTNLTHEIALFQVHSGRTLPGYPSFGSWVTYALGSENQNLPAYVVLDDPEGLPINRTQNWQSGFLPPVYQGTRFRATGEPLLHLKREYDEPDRVTFEERQLQRSLDQLHKDRRPFQSQLDARLASYELAARMQLSAVEALDFSQETAETLKMYGIDEPATDSYGRRCLIARRLVERGVRFVQLFINGQIWDNHNEISSTLKSACEKTDKPIAALLKDLKQRGLFDHVLVLWGGEMGRLPIAQLPGDKDERKAGRDHNKNAMVQWLAGAGVKSGTIYGETDEVGLAAAVDKVSITDWHATVLHLLGFDYKHLSYPRNGLEERLTGVSEARVVQEILS
ncbi:MAG: DUF1501 domain-containing protein [Planctomycetota bacterium]|nr:DUF1501 domain-containing protein [Planctomycetota bacterium]